MGEVDIKKKKRKKKKITGSCELAWCLVVWVLFVIQFNIPFIIIFWYFVKILILKLKTFKNQPPLITVSSHIKKR